MSRQVTFDYSKAGSFISEEEIGYMKKLILDAKETLLSKTGAGRKSSPASRQQRRRSRLIPTFCWLSVSVVLIWEPERLSSS